MDILITIGFFAFVGLVIRAGYKAAGGAEANWIGDNDDDVSSWDDDDGFLDDDIYTSPVYSHFICNVWHDPFEDDFTWSSSSDDWMWDNSDD